MTALLEVKEVAVAFGGVRAVDGVSLHVDQGEILTIIGPNGAGKTSIINLISRVYNPAAGRILFQGTDITRLPAHRVAALGIVRTFQNIELFDRASVLQNLLLGFHVARRTSLFSELLFLPSAARQEEEARLRAEQVIDFLELQQWRDQPAGSLPYGVRKVVELARALVARPRLLLLDEPSSGLNVEETGDMVFWIRDIRDRFGTTIVMVEHDMRLVAAVSDRVVAMNQGRVLSTGTAAQVQHDPAVVEAYLGRQRHGTA